MKKKRVSFDSVPRPLSPIPFSSSSSLSSVSLSPCPPQVPNDGPQSVRPPAPPPHQIKFPSVVSKPPPTLEGCKASRLHRSSGVSCTPCPVNPHSSPSLPLGQVVSHTANQCPLLPNPPPGPFLPWPLGRGFTGLSPSPAKSPLSATISPPLDRPVNCLGGQESLPQGTAQRFRCQTPAVRREQNTVGRSHR